MLRQRRQRQQEPKHSCIVFSFNVESETKKETIAQLKQFDAQLKKMVQGNMGLVTELASYQLAIQESVYSICVYSCY